MRSNEIKAEIEERFGFLPPFFEPALDKPLLLETLWQETLSAYVENPLPTPFKERLFAYLSSFCRVPYCIVCHTCVLRPLGLTVGEVLDLLEPSAPLDAAELSSKVATLSEMSVPLEEWPRAASTLEDALFAAAILVFAFPEHSEHSRTTLRSLLADEQYAALVAFLAYVKTCHSWVESFPELSYEADERAKKQLGPLLPEEPRLAEFLATYQERLTREAKAEAERVAEVAETEKRHERADAALREADERLRKVFEEGPIAMAILERDLRFIKANDAFCRLFGYSDDELRQLTFADLTYPEDIDLDAQLAKKIVSGEIPDYRVEKRYVTKAQEVIWGHLSATVIRGGDGQPLYSVGIVEDITARKSSDAELRHFADHDSLTGLFNRHRFEEVLQRYVAQTARYGRGGALLVGDLDNLKSVNDALGHKAGDELILRVGELLRARLRRTDTLARFGGDEYAVLLPEIEEAEARSVAESLLDAVRGHSMVVDGGKVRSTMSMGLTLFAGEDRTPTQLLANADLAMYEAKSGGRDRVCVYEPEASDEQRTAALESAVFARNRIMATSIDKDFRTSVMRPARNRIQSMAKEGRALDEINSWLVDLPLTDLEYDIAFILASNEVRRCSPTVERYRESIEEGIGG
jgi:diguanylate cyclase (GGDEF)-like protein/PAS domain S-box-containing protein